MRVDFQVVGEEILSCGNWCDVAEQVEVLGDEVCGFLLGDGFVLVVRVRSQGPAIHKQYGG